METIPKLVVSALMAVVLQEWGSTIVSTMYENTAFPQCHPTPTLSRSPIISYILPYTFKVYRQ